MRMLTEFKTFALRGNVWELAVGIVIGGAFGKIVSSLVNDVIMPPIGMLVAGVDFSNLKLVLKPGTLDAAGKTVGEAAIFYGNFINTLISFLMIAGAIFMLTRPIITVRKKEEAAPPPPAKPSAEVQLLTEIRDLIKDRPQA